MNMTKENIKSIDIKVNDADIAKQNKQLQDDYFKVITNHDTFYKKDNNKNNWRGYTDQKFLFELLKLISPKDAKQLKKNIEKVFKKKINMNIYKFIRNNSYDNEICSNEKQLLALNAIRELYQRYNKESLNSIRQIRKVDDVEELAHEFFHGKTREHVVVFLADSTLHVFDYKIINIGVRQSSEIDLNKLYKWALQSNAITVLLMHNHPSGSAAPSAADIKTAKLIRNGLKTLDMFLLDSIIVTNDDYYSLFRNGFFDDKPSTEEHRVKTGRGRKQRSQIKHNHFYKKGTK